MRPCLHQNFVALALTTGKVGRENRCAEFATHTSYTLEAGIYSQSNYTSSIVDPVDSVQAVLAMPAVGLGVSL